MAEHQKYTLPECKTICCVGDSITFGLSDEEGLGWPARLAQKLAQEKPMEYFCHTVAKGGDTSRDAWHSLTSRVGYIGPSHVIMMIGVNDLCFYESDDCAQGTRLHQNEQVKLWDELIGPYLQKQAYKTLVVGPLPVEQDVTAYHPKSNDEGVLTGRRWENMLIKEYNDRQKAICEKYGLSFVSFFDDWIQKQETLYADGIHPNAKGHALLAEQIHQALTSKKLIS